MYRTLKRWRFLVLLGECLAAMVFARETGESITSLPEVTVKENILRDEPSEESTFETESERVSFSEIARHPSVQLGPSLTASSPPSFSLRGMDASQTVIFFEGIPLTDPVFYSDNLSLIPKLAINKVELFPEAAPASLLSPTLGGAVNLELQDEIKKEKILGHVGNLGRVRMGGQSKIASGFSIDLEYEQAKENFIYQDNNGTPFNEVDDQPKERIHNSFQRVSLLPSIRLGNSQRDNLHIFSLNSFQAAEVPGPTHLPEPFKLQDWNSLSAVRGRATLADNLLGESVVFFRFRGDELRNDLEKDRSLNYTGGARASVEIKEKLWKSGIAVGFNYTKYEYDGEIQKRRQFDVTRLEIPASLTGDFSFGESFHIKPAFLGSLTNSNWNSSPRLGFEYNPRTNFRIFGFVGAVFRGPSLSELYGNQLGISPNPDLQAERANKAEFGAQWFPFMGSNFSRSQLSFSVYGAKAINLISFSRIGPDLQRAENIGKAVWVGHELSLNLKEDSGYFVRPSLVLLWTRNDSQIAAEQGKRLPNRFPLTAQWEAGLDRETWNIVHRATFFSSSFLDKSNQEQLGSYQIHDLYLGLKVKEAGRLEFSIQNLFNITLASASLAGVEISKVVSGVNGYPSAGRRVGVTWLYDF